MGTFMALLRSAPVLQTLIFSEGILLYKKKAVEEMVPECFFSHLKVVEFKKFKGKDDLDFAKFLLSNAMELEVMAITSFGDLKWGAERNLVWVKRQLSKCTRASSRATISFS